LNHLNRRSLTFYGVAITSVVILFQAVSTYGEANLKAPPDLRGQYQVAVTPALDCLQTAGASQPSLLLLTLQQSGIYMTADLRVVKNASEELLPEALVQASKQRPSLIGKIDDQSFLLEGSSSLLTGCAATNPTQPVSVMLKAKPQDKQLVGSLQFLAPDASSRSTASEGTFNFTTTRLDTPSTSKPAH
jgi:hypothetical protein